MHHDQKYYIFPRVATSLQMNRRSRVLFSRIDSTKSKITLSELLMFARFQLLDGNLQYLAYSAKVIYPRIARKESIVRL